MRLDFSRNLTCSQEKSGTVGAVPDHFWDGQSGSFRTADRPNSDQFCRNLLRNSRKNADRKSIGAQAVKRPAQKQGAGTGWQPAEARRLHPRLHHDPEKAEFGAAESGQGPADQWF
jgi:hypothetical protein